MKLCCGGREHPWNMQRAVLIARSGATTHATAGATLIPHFAPATGPAHSIHTGRETVHNLKAGRATSTAYMRAFSPPKPPWVRRRYGHGASTGTRPSRAHRRRGRVAIAAHHLLGRGHDSATGAARPPAQLSCGYSTAAGARVPRACCRRRTAPPRALTHRRDTRAARPSPPWAPRHHRRPHRL
jgi:hypothetical protein